MYVCLYVIYLYFILFYFILFIYFLNFKKNYTFFNFIASIIKFKKCKFKTKEEQNQGF